MPNEISEQVAGPAHTPFQHRESERGEAPGHAAQDERLGEGMAGMRKMADMVVGKIVHRLAAIPAHTTRMGRHGNFELDACGPEGIVVIGTIECQ